MTRPAKILLIGDIYDNHICRFITHLKDVNPNIEVDIYNRNNKGNINGKEYPPCAKLYGKIYTKKKHFPDCIYDTKIGGSIAIYIDRYLFCRKIKTKYDLINIHFLTLDSYVIRRYFKKITKKLMITPWGSDVYRMEPKWYTCNKEIYDMADYVSAIEGKFKNDIKKIFNVPQNKIVDLDIGSDSIDTIINNEDITRDIAKSKLNIEGNYVIACGYNGTKGQNHTEIINALLKIKNQLPENLVLILQMTYGATSQYLAEIKTLLEKCGFKYLLFDKYLSEKDLLYVRKSADMFIHAQPTDAFSGSLQEYILCGAKVVNGKWTRYPTLETYEIPYYLFNSFEELSNVILDVYNGKVKINVSEKTIRYIQGQAWSNLIKKWSAFYDSCV